LVGHHPNPLAPYKEELSLLSARQCYPHTAPFACSSVSLKARRPEMADPDNRDGVVILVGVKTDVREAVRVNVTFPEDVLEQIDRFAEAHGYTRSGFLARAAKHAMEHEKELVAV
jgi:hypothetical protein